MGTINDDKGCSVCTAGKENYTNYTSRVGRKPLKMVQYDYRHTDGELFSCVGRTLEACRLKRDAWLERKCVTL